MRAFLGWLLMIFFGIALALIGFVTAAEFCEEMWKAMTRDYSNARYVRKAFMALFVGGIPFVIALAGFRWGKRIVYPYTELGGSRWYGVAPDPSTRPVMGWTLMIVFGLGLLLSGGAVVVSVIESLMYSRRVLWLGEIVLVGSVAAIISYLLFRCGKNMVFPPEAFMQPYEGAPPARRRKNGLEYALAEIWDEIKYIFTGRSSIYDGRKRDEGR